MTILGSNPKARVNTQHPETFAICDRCSNLRNLVDLRWQMEWRGNMLSNTYFLVCDPCYDIPFELNRPKYLPPDPVPVKNARPPQWAAQSEGTGPNPMNQQPITDDLILETESGLRFVTLGGDLIVAQE